MHLIPEVSLALHSSFRIGGPCRHFAAPRKLESLARLVERLEDEGTPYFLLGGGTNTLFPDHGFDGAVISTKHLDHIRTAEPGLVRAEAGSQLGRVISESLTQGLAGLEQFVGIPGTIGGAVYGNAGAADQAIGDRVEAITVVDPDGSFRRISGEDVPWRYRSSGLCGAVVAEVFLRLTPTDPEELVDRARELIRRKGRTQPLRAWSAGCVFRNPTEGPAAQLIDAAGLKGTRIGGACVSEKHANFIVNDGTATARDVRELMVLVQRQIQDRFGVNLVHEIVSPGNVSPGDETTRDGSSP